MDYRASYGERINGNSWLMRDIWQKTHNRYSHRIGLAVEPEQLKKGNRNKKYDFIYVASCRC